MNDKVIGTGIVAVITGAAGHSGSKGAGPKRHEAFAFLIVTQVLCYWLANLKMETLLVTGDITRTNTSCSSKSTVYNTKK